MPPLVTNAETLDEPTLTSVTVFDTVTGEKRATSEQPRYFEWEENNWSCDCNRSGLFDPSIGDEMAEKMRELHPGIPEHVGICLESERFIVVDFEPKGSTDLWRMNCRYPPEMLSKYGITEPE